jgi:hypothetical protein
LEQPLQQMEVQAKILVLAWAWWLFAINSAMTWSIVIKIWYGVFNT